MSACAPESKSRPRQGRRRLLKSIIMKRLQAASVLGRPGSDLLFQVLRLSTIGAGKFYGRVRDGIGYRLPASTTRPAKDGFASQAGAFVTHIPDQTFDQANAH